MSKPKKPRNKKYQPKRIFPGGGLSALLRIEDRAIAASPLNCDQQTDLGGAYWLAFTNMTIGNASKESWSCVVCALNIGMALCEAGIGAEYEQDFVAALDGAFRAKIRSQKTGSFRLDGEAIQAIRHAMTIHDAQILVTHKRELVAAMQTVRTRIDEGNVYTIDEPA